MEFRLFIIFSENIKVITRIMKVNNVDFEFIFRVRKYLEYCFNVENENEKEEFIFKKLSPSIQDEYHYHVYGQKILNIPFFKNNFSPKCLRSITKIIKKIDLAPEETFIKVL